MVQLILGVALVAALGVAAMRRLRRRSAPRQRGTSPASAIPVRSYASIDRHIARQRCGCGATLAVKGESSRDHGGRRLRVVRLECRSCESEERLYFDTTRVPH